MRFVRICLGIFVCFLLSGSIPASAQQRNITDRDAEALRGVIQQFMDDQKSFLVPTLGASLVYDGRVTTERVGRYYAFTLPHMKLMYSNGRVFEIGMISINAVPDKVQGRWIMTMAFPTPMVMFNAEKSAVMRIDIGSQNTKAVWDSRLGGFMEFDSTLKQIKIDGVSLNYALHIPIASAKYNFEDNQFHVLLGKTAFALELGDMFHKDKN